MAYSDFTLEKVKSAFEIEVLEGSELFKDIKAIAPTDRLTSILQDAAPLAIAIGTEKARSEMIITPVLLEVWKHIGANNLSLFSGIDFNVDSSLGLVGFCDFILSGSSEQFYVQAPVVMLVEAKNENMKAGLGQCIAEMIAANIFNNRSGVVKPSRYGVLGVVTTGELWRFLTLTEGKLVSIDKRTYYLSELEFILGVFVTSINR